MIQVKGMFLLFISILVWNCKPKCSGENPRTEVYIVSSAKKSLVSFSQGTTWIFQSTSTTERDTIIFETKIKRPMDEGACVQNRDCCSKYYYENIEQNFTVKSNSGLNNFTGYELKAQGFNIKSSYQAIPMQNGDVIYNSFPGYSFKDNLTLSISGRTLNDIQLSGVNNNINTLVICYWSAQYGLVKYTYKTLTGTVIKEYERVDLP